jgi:prepilin-type N-terminal cleavage/methylation domain-containing protein
MRGFTLLELVLVLALVALVSAITLPVIYRSSLNGNEEFENRLAYLAAQLWSPSGTYRVCVDFVGNDLSFGKEKLTPPFRLKSLVLRGRLISGEQFNRYCFTPPQVGEFLITGRERAILVFMPLGEVHYYRLSEGELETLKDKVEKGRISEWFRYY